MAPKSSIEKQNFNGIRIVYRPTQRHSSCSIHRNGVQRSGGPRGGSWGSLEPPFETKLFHFHGEFAEKSGKNINNQVQLTNRSPFVNLNPCQEIMDPPLNVHVLCLSGQLSFDFLFI